MEMKKFYNKLYEENPSFYKLKSLDFKIIENLELKKGKILDLGCGQGSNAFHLSKIGFEVTAVDLSNTAIKQLKKKSKRIKASCQDITKFKFVEKYEIILSLMTLQYLIPKERNNLINKMKSNTFPGGYNLITIPTQTKISGFKNAIKNKIELKEFYKDWKIILLEEKGVRFNDKKEGTIARILARKPTKAKPFKLI